MHLALSSDRYANNFCEWVVMAFISSFCIMLPFITVLGFRRWLFTAATHTKGVLFIIAYLASLGFSVFITLHLPYQDMHPTTEHGVLYMNGMATGLSLYIAIRLAVLVFKEQYDPNLVPLQAVIKARKTHKPMPDRQIQRRKESLFDDVRRPQIRSMPAVGIELLLPTTGPNELPREYQVPATVTTQAPVASLPTAVTAPPTPHSRPSRPTASVRKPARRGRHAA